MQEFTYKNISGIEWKIDNPKKVVVISHGMAEHAKRYDYFATKLNEAGFAVYAIDQIGHGGAIKDNRGHWEPGDFNHCVENLYTLVGKAKEEYPDRPVILFGHSMGSFLSQQFIKVHGDSIEKVILSGSAKTGSLHKMGKFVSSFFSGGDQKKENKFLNNLSFGSYNKDFAPNRTDFDWLSRDNEQVDKYVADPLCGYCCTTGFFREFLKGLAQLNDNLEFIPKELPIYIMSGSKDPVGAASRDVKALYEMYKELGIKDVELKLYEDGRHEMLNETNKDEVIADIVNYLNK